MKTRRQREDEWGRLCDEAVTGTPLAEEFVEIAFYVARQIWIELERGHFAAAHDLIDEAQAEAGELQAEQRPRFDPLTSIRVKSTLHETLADTRVHDILSVRTANALEERGIGNAAKLVDLNPDDLIGLPNFGDRTIREIRNAIESLIDGHTARTRRDKCKRCQREDARPHTVTLARPDADDVGTVLASVQLLLCSECTRPVIERLSGFPTELYAEGRS